MATRSFCASLLADEVIEAEDTERGLALDVVRRLGFAAGGGCTLSHALELGPTSYDEE